MSMVNEMQKAALSTRLGIPILYGIDAVHGHNTVYNATIFPHNVGLGATRQVCQIFFIFVSASCNSCSKHLHEICVYFLLEIRNS